ncbi:glycosyltransferase family 4 protein [Salinibacterium sp. SWN1162]|uniref:glycosyltransferase family 4 protein n=1 Tax=Salinibacterium sp. SWN1162 TaxID=2792053 RepID=UPI0018CEEB02|nr:glycosyltransferase family 4 protein [Salinibacterium sp. SWN1162]MBH0008750.1 glycosyltransferase family 4 protein [Salinibacterium sp. SWN1162]
MRIAIASRIFEPEPSAASFRLAVLAEAFADAEHEVTVLTVVPPPALRGTENDHSRPYRVKRNRVLRDATGYVRGYLQYMSFDIPLFFRILFGAKRDLIVVEPPPTTGFFVRIAAALRRTPYAYYAADIWSDASESTGAPGLVVRVVRAMERSAMHGACGVLSVNEGVSARIREIAPRAVIHTVGNGINTSIFSADGPVHDGGKYAIYPGTASEWQGAAVFIDALARVLPDHPEAKLVFLGQGSDWDTLRARAALLPDGVVTFVATVPPAEAAAWLRGAVVSLASIRPDAGYSFAFPTKVFASWATGTPVIFAGPGPVRQFITRRAGEAALGVGCDYAVEPIESALRDAFGVEPRVEARQLTAAWAAQNVSLAAVAERAVQALTDTNRRGEHGS